MTGTPLFAGPLATPAAPAAAAPAAAPVAAAPAVQPGAGKPMFAGPLAPNQPQAAPAEQSAPQASGLAEKLSQFGSGAEEGLLGLGDAAQAIVTPGGAGQFATNLIRTIMGGPDLSTSAPVHKMLEDNGLITPPTSDPVDKITRAVGTALGGAVIPEAGMEGLTIDALKGLIPAATSGLAQGTADVVAPDNPLVSTIAGIAGGLAPSTISSTVRAATSAGKALPSLDELISSTRNADLRAAKEQAYQAVDNSGVRYSPLAYNDLVNKIMDGAAADNMNPGLTPKTAAFIQTDVAGKPQMYAPTLTQADQLRQQASRSLAKSSDAGESHFGNQIIGHIDDFLNNADPAQMVNGSAPDAADLINNARAANTKLAKVNNLDDAIQRAITNTASSGSGGNINNALRQQLKPFLNDRNMSRGLSDEEKQAVARIIQTPMVENVLRTVGKVAPGGNGLMSQINLLGMMLNPALAIAPAVGSVAKAVADGGTQQRVADLREMFRTGQAPEAKSFFTPQQKNAMSAALLSAIMRPAGQQGAQSNGGAQ